MQTFKKQGMPVIEKVGKGYLESLLRVHQTWLFLPMTVSNQLESIL